MKRRSKVGINESRRKKEGGVQVLTLRELGARINELRGRKEGGAKAPTLGRLGAKYFALLYYSCFIITYFTLVHGGDTYVYRFVLM
jgi:hypothetical protein